MPNERLRSVIAATGQSIASVAEHVGVDGKTVERWITTGRVPYRSHRWKAASFLESEELYLWPSCEADATSVSGAELVEFYPHRGAVPMNLWASLLDHAKSQIEILVYAGLFLFDSRPDMAEQLASKSRAGAQVRILLGNPDSELLSLRGEEEGIGEGLAARARMSLAYLRPVLDDSGIQLRLHETILYNSIYRFDEDALVNVHVLGAPAGQNPVLHLRHVPGGRTFRHYMKSFDTAWEQGSNNEPDRPLQ